jgi:hypothetical protein
MLYVRLICTWIEDGKQRDYIVSRPAGEKEKYLVTQAKRIKKECPKATDIKVVEAPFNDGYPHAVDGLIDIILQKRPDLSREVLSELHWTILTTDRRDYKRGAYICSLAEAKQIIEDRDTHYMDWVYIRPLNIVIFDVTKHTSHQIFLSYWYFILTYLLTSTPPYDTIDKIADECLDYDEDSEKFLLSDYGFFKTSAYGVGTVLKSEKMKLTAQEKTAFARYTFRDL